MIDVVGLVKHYEELKAVDGLDFRVEPGEILGLVGPNGAGKTTTLRCISGIVPPTAGTVRLDGHDLEGAPVEARRSLAFVSDEPRLFDYLTAMDHMSLVARLYRVSDGQERAEGLLKELELGDRFHSFPSELSRGMKQKLMVAMALLHRPRVLILDEPLTGLDPGAMRRMRQRIVATAADGAAVLLSSHMLHLVEELCRRIVILNHGKKVLEGSLEEISRQLGGADGDVDLEQIFIHATEGPQDPA